MLLFENVLNVSGWRGWLWLLFMSLRFVLIPFWIFIFLKDHFFLVAIHWALNLGYQHRGSTFRCIYVTDYWKCKLSTLFKSCSGGVDFRICWCLAFLVFLTPPPASPPMRPPKLTLHYWLSIPVIKRRIPTFPWLILNSLPWSVVATALLLDLLIVYPISYGKSILSVLFVWLRLEMWILIIKLFHNPLLFMFYIWFISHIVKLASSWVVNSWKVSA